MTAKAVSVLKRINRMPRGKVRLFGGGEVGVIRWDPGRKLWWVMDRKDEGWASYGVPHKTIRDVMGTYAINVTGHGRDTHSAFYTFEPCVPAAAEGMR